MSSRNKRQRIGNAPAPREFGAPSADDSPSTQLNRDPSSSALSTRAPQFTSVPTLTSLCSRIFAENFVRLRNNESIWHETSVYLQMLPEALLPRTLLELVRACPTYLKHEFIVTYFFRGPSLVLSSSLPGVQSQTITALPRMKELRELELFGFEKISDTTFASVLPRLPSLKVLVLRGCTRVGPKTLLATAEKCRQLQTVNLNYTTVTPASLLPLLLACPRLEVLKLAGISNWRLDISFTGVRHPLLGPYDMPGLEKLHMTSTGVSNHDLLAILPRLTTLKSLSIGALGASERSIASIDSSMTLTDETLLAATPMLQFCALDNVSLVGNIKLGTSTAAILCFVADVGRNCKWLNLSGIPSLRSRHLAGLQSVDGAPSRLETLILNNTGIDDTVAPFIASCPELVWLEVAETKMTSEGLFLVLDSCTKLQKLGLKSCRGVRVGDRRHFFEVRV
ncbi:RNI-like protein [Mycena sp. CBHHK59/15]|nr:RNI-like protein [Mycena sp. CBHHK59/15]